MRHCLVLMVGAMALMGCRQQPSFDATPQEAAQLKYQLLPPDIAEEEYALDVIEARVNQLLEGKRMSSDTAEQTAADQQPTTGDTASAVDNEIQQTLGENQPISTSEDVPEPTGFSAWVLNMRAWLFFVAYCLVALIASWYVKTTGSASTTLTEIMAAIDKRLNFKQRAMFRVLKLVYNKVFHRNSDANEEK